VWCEDRFLGALTYITSYKATEKLALEEFNTYYSKKYELKNIVPCAKTKVA
jgi:hypothetical protein